jgi:hypothetical protein
MKSAEAYNKACKSLALCPVRYHRPRELTALVGIGDKTAQMLEVKWAAYCKDNGLPLPGDISPSTSSSFNFDPVRLMSRKERKSQSPRWDLTRFRIRRTT